MRTLSLPVLAVLALGCGDDPRSNPAESSLVSDEPLQVSATASLPDQNGLVTISARITNSGGSPLIIRVRCTPIELDRNDGGTWRRFGDLRLCAPPDRTTVPARTTVNVDDQRQLSAGEYRVVIELVDGGQAVSTSFEIR